MLNQSESGVLGYHDEEPGVVASPSAPVVTFANHTCAMRLVRHPFSAIQNIFPKVGQQAVCDTVWFYYALLGRVRTNEYKGHHPLFRDAFVPVPPIVVQRRIASILSAYDELIENNTRRIAILEEMARRIYEEWFVRFRFPGHEGVWMVESELGMVPEGWAITELGALLSVEKGLSYKGAGLTEKGVPMVNLKNILPGGGFRRDGTKPYSGEYKPRHVVRAGDIVLANTDLTQAGTVVGSPAIVPSMGVGECIFSHHIYAVRLQAAMAPNRPYVYWLLAHDSFKSFAKGHAVGTTVLGMPKEGVTNFRFARPPEDLMRRFSSVAAPIHELAETLHAKNANLQATRDLLLPQLISGELDVSAIPEPEALAA